MGSATDKLKGHVNEAIGKAKQGIGEATNNPRLKEEGRAQEFRGEAQQVKGKAKEVIKEHVDRA